MKKPLLFIIIIVIISISTPFWANAQCDCSESDNIVCIPDPLGCKEIGDVVKAITGLLKVLAIPLATAIIIISGIQYLVSAGDQARTERAKKTMLYAVIGLAIVLAVDFLVGIVQEILGSTNGDNGGT